MIICWTRSAFFIALIALSDKLNRLLDVLLSAIMLINYVLTSPQREEEQLNNQSWFASTQKKLVLTLRMLTWMLFVRCWMEALSEDFQHVRGKMHVQILLGVCWCVMFILLFLKFYNFIKGVMHTRNIFRKPKTNVFILHLWTF